ncbi:zinc finger protein 569 [Malaya genurostris]|uniref:zinc finger protein 569 n=1 Tax=Malaya genurostris TaxID=325434 RepID=UPI0026F3DFE1|nr:zinc finger protein 569 [Malaya genurostris]XP_058449494.1 zinc finger protein 569 [Malaya genurostris]
MSSDEDYVPPPLVRKRGRPPKSVQEPVAKKSSDDELDGIHYACSVCDQVFLHKSNYLRHKKRHEPPGGFICSLCQQPFTTDWDRNQHKRSEHSVFRCRLCKEEFPVEDDYNNHVQNEHDGRDREYDMCPTCGQQFRSVAQMKAHIASKCGSDKKYECQICQSRYLTQASLNAHMIKHYGEKSHLCNYCGASFLNKGQLKVHERMHTGEKPYKCNQCDKAFAHRESLITHSTTHSGIKPYYCSHCESRFSCIGNLLKHRRARPDTCGLPQYCQTNKIVARPNIKTMPNLTDRQVNNQKVVQRSGPPREKKPKLEEITVDQLSPKKRVGRRAPKPKIAFEDLPDNSNQSTDEEEEDEKPTFSELAHSTEIEIDERSFNHNYSKLVTLKVEPGEIGRSNDAKEEAYDRKPEGTTEMIEIVDVKVEDDDEEHYIVEGIDENSAGETIVSEEILSETIDFDNYIVGSSQDECFKENVSHYYDDDVKIEEIDEPTKEQKLLFAKKEFDRELATSFLDDDDSDEATTARHNESVNVRKVFTEKPPVVLTKKRRGRPKRPYIPKRLPKDAIIVDIAQQKRELKAERQIFDDNVKQISIDCFRCEHCPSQYTTEYLIGRHLERTHGILFRCLLETLQYSRVWTKDRKYKCRYCDRLYANERALEKHIPLHGPNGIKNHKCPCCVTFYENEEDALDHAYAEHPHRMICHICDRRFMEPDVQANHMKNVHSEKGQTKYSYVCPKCGKNFSSRSAVSDHERANCGQDPIYKCEICEKCLHSASSLKHHYSIHTEEYPHSCQYCGKSYRTYGQVKVHERTHTGEKPFVCPYCSKGFGHRESYHTHLSLHTGIKRYMCSGCGLRFSCVSNLQAHKRSHKTTCGLVPNASKIVSGGYHELPEGYVLPYPRNDNIE